MRADPGTNGAGEEKVQPPAAETSDSAERRFQDLEQQAADAQLQLSRIEGLLMHLCAPTLVSAGQAAGAAVEGYDVATAAAVGGVAGADQPAPFATPQRLPRIQAGEHALGRAPHLGRYPP